MAQVLVVREEVHRWWKLFPSRALLQDLGRLEARAMARAELLERLDREARAELVEIAERPAQERREAQAEDRAHVAVARRAQDPLLQAEGALVQEREQQRLWISRGSNVRRSPAASSAYTDGSTRLSPL
jgi:hypothetical protein